MTDPTDYESATIAALLSAPELVTLVPLLRPRHFADPRLGAIFDACVAAEQMPGVKPDVQVVARVLTERKQMRPGYLDGGFLANLLSSLTTSINVAFYAQQVIDAARRRALLALVPKLSDVVEHSADDDTMVAGIELALREIEQVATPIDVATARTLDGFAYLDDFLAFGGGDDEPWVIPGMVRRMERVVVVAPEGLGKSMLARQLAVAVAAGRHPFAQTVAIQPLRTLIVDLENPPGIIRAKMRPIVETARAYGSWDPTMATIWHRPGGINLRDPVDQLLLERAVDQARPALICFGPVYKSFVEGSNERAEQAVREVIAVLDRLREKYGCALWLEHHAPLDQGGSGRRIRPFGSAVWLRWPEFGLAMSPPDGRDPTRLELSRWRGDRDERDWPDQLIRGQPAWPWEASWKAGMPRWMRESERTIGTRTRSAV